MQMSLTCKVRITLNGVAGEKARAVERALEPDNVDFPDGLGMSVESAGGRLVFTFEGRRDIGKMIGSIDEVLGHAQVALRVMG